MTGQGPDAVRRADWIRAPRRLAKAAVVAGQAATVLTYRAVRIRWTSQIFEGGYKAGRRDVDDIRAELLRLAIDLDETIAEEAATTISEPDTLHLFSMLSATAPPAGRRAGHSRT